MTHLKCGHWIKLSVKCLEHLEFLCLRLNEGFILHLPGLKFCKKIVKDKIKMAAEVIYLYFMLFLGTTTSSFMHCVQLNVHKMPMYNETSMHEREWDPVFTCVHSCLCSHVFTHACVHMCPSMPVFTCICSCWCSHVSLMSVLTCVHPCLCSHVFNHASVHMCPLMPVFTYDCSCLCSHVYAHAWVHMGQVLLH